MSAYQSDIYPIRIQRHLSDKISCGNPLHSFDTTVILVITITSVIRRVEVTSSHITRATRNFSKQGRFPGIRHFDKHFVKISRKKGRREKIWRFFSQIFLKLHFDWKTSPKDGRNQGFFQNLGHFFNFRKRARQAIPLTTSCGLVYIQ